MEENVMEGIALRNEVARSYSTMNFNLLLKRYPDPPAMRFFHAAPFDYAWSRDIPDLWDMYIEQKTFP
jgi:hypothetical protein